MRARGFTMLELLVSLAVLGMIGVLLASGIGKGRRLWDRMDARAARWAGIEAAQDIIRARIEAIAPLTRYDAVSPYADVNGTRDRMFFIAPALPDRQPDALADYRLSMSTGSELVLSATSDIAPEKTPARDDRVLLRNVARVDFAYFGASPPDNLRRWRDEWYNRPTAPELVRLRIAFAPGDPRVWPDLLVRPAATVDTQCVLNARTGQCKGR